jgi:hypothetical protein
MKPDLVSRARLFRTWLEDCENNHPNCNKYKTSERPSRILEIDPLASPTAIRLLSVEATPFHDRYAALSHRWPATTSPYSLKKSKIKQYQISIPILQLPNNFVDAIEITKALGLKHLWIDSLCIIQDSTADWETESAKMDIVYLNAAVTIAASVPNDANGGSSLDLLQPTCLRLSLPIRNAGNSSKRIHVKGILRSRCASQFAIPDSQLSKRGWVLQEMALSPRILHFAQDQAYWQCRERVESEDGTLRIPHVDGGPIVECLEERLDRTRLVPNTIPENDLQGLWWSWAIDYSSRTFTKTNDKLYACAGITRFYQHLSGSSAVVLGLLRQRLLKDLTWRFEDDQPHYRNTTTNLPSWSWLGWNSALFPSSTLVVGEGWSHPAQATILSVEVVWSGQELTTPLKRAEIKLLGRLTTMLVSTSIISFSIGNFSVEYDTASLEFPPDFGWIADTSKTITYSARARFDMDVPHGGSAVHCVEMETFWKTIRMELAPTSDPPWSCIFEVTQKLLILRPIDIGAETFERIGIATICYENVKDWSTAFDNLNPQVITLI